MQTYSGPPKLSPTTFHKLQKARSFAQSDYLQFEVGVVRMSGVRVVNGKWCEYEIYKIKGDNNERTINSFQENLRDFHSTRE